MTRCIPSLALICLFVGPTIGAAQDSTRAAVNDSFPWRKSVVYGYGPSVGPPRSDFSGKTPPSVWCLAATRPPSGDLANLGLSWDETSRSWLRQILTEAAFREEWTKLIPEAPLLVEADSIVQETNEAECQRLSTHINRQLLGWKVGPPPIVIYRVRDLVLAFPSNAREGEWGLMVAMDSTYQLKKVILW